MPDRLSHLLQRFELRARVVQSGAVRGGADFAEGSAAAQLRLVRRGTVSLKDGCGRRTEVREPSAIFYARRRTHRLDADERVGADVLCADIDFGVGDENPLLRSLPDRVIVALADSPTLQTTATLLFAEAFGQRCGRAAVVDRLTEVLMVQLLRHAIEQRLADGGSMAGLADARLMKLLTALHAHPAKPWTLDAMAAVAGMSRSRFAAHFATTVGVPPAEYLTQWRIGLAKNLLRRGKPVKQVANDVGYGSANAFGRTFCQVVGLPPKRWQLATGAAGSASTTRRS